MLFSIPTALAVMDLSMHHSITSKLINCASHKYLIAQK